MKNLDEKSNGFTIFDNIFKNQYRIDLLKDIKLQNFKKFNNLNLNDLENLKKKSIYLEQFENKDNLIDFQSIVIYTIFLSSILIFFYKFK